jgi:hypothetical protein
LTASTSASSRSSRTDASGAWPPGGARQVEPVGVRRVDEQLGRRLGDQHVRLARVDADVALAALLAAQRGPQPLVRGEGLAEDDAPPAALEDDVRA